MRAVRIASCLVSASLVVAVAGAAPRAPSLKTTIFDFGQRLDINNVSMVVTNTGSFAFDKPAANPGLEFPKGSGKTAVFASGLWVGARVGGSIRMAVSEYSDEFGPGVVLPDGLPDDRNRSEHKVYKLNRVYPTTAERDADLADYNDGAVPYGAPPVAVNPNGTLSVLGDQMTWAVYNDADPALHTNDAGSTIPLGVEVQQTTFGFTRQGALGNTVFLTFKILNKGNAVLEDFYAALWSDPDLGGFTDDLVGCEPGRGLGYCYNATNNDIVYGTAPPAVGYDLLRAIKLPDETPFPLTAFIKYINGTDPGSAAESYNYLSGFLADGSPIVDPTTGQSTTFFHPGDPVTGTGWLDSNPADRRFVLCSGPFRLEPGQGVELVGAIVIGDGTDRLNSITRLRAYDDEVQEFFDRGFNECTPVAMGFDLTPNTLNLRSLGRWVTGYLEPPAPLAPGDIEVASVRLNEAVPVDPAGPVEIGDADGDGLPDLMVKFSRAAIQAALPQGAAVPVTASGLVAGQCFSGTDVIRVLHANVAAPAAGAVLAPGVMTPVRWEVPGEVHVQVLWAAVLSSLDDGTTWNLEAGDLPNTGVYYWRTPYATSDRCRVAVVLVESADETGDVVEGVLGIGDNFSIGSATGVGPDGELTLELVGVAPNPGGGPLRASFNLPSESPATLALYDIGGRRVLAREVGGLGRGAHTVTLAEAGTVSAGIYLVRLTQDGRGLVARAIVLP